MKINRVIVRETDCLERGSPIMIEVHPRELVLRLKGQRRRYSVSYAGILWTAAQAEADRARKDKLLAGRIRKRR